MSVKGAIHLWQFAGIRVALHPICLLYLPLGVTVLALGPLAESSDNGPVTNWLLACVTIVLMAVSIWLHELGHLLTAVYYKLPIRQTTLYPFGGIAQMGSIPIPFLPFVLMILAGPFASLVQAVIWLGLWLATDVTICLWLAQFNGAMALFNLLPVTCLDGGNLIKLLRQSFLSPQLTTLIGFLTSVYLPLGFTLSGGVAFLFGLFLHNTVWVLTGFLLVLTGLLIQAAPEHIMLSCTPGQIKGLDRIPAAELYTQLSNRTILEKIKANRANGHLTHNETLLPYPFSADTHGPLLQIVQPKQKQLPTLQPWLVYPTTSLLQALYKLDSVKASTLLMVEESHIIGTISHDHILQYLAAQEACSPPRSTNLFMLLKSNTALEEPLYLS